MVLSPPPGTTDMQKWLKDTDNRSHHSNGGWLDQSAGWFDITSAQWNIFRRVGDLLHIVGTLILLFCILNRKSVIGISWKTQLLYTTVFCTRYLDLTTNVHEFLGGKETPERRTKVEYLILFKSTYIVLQFLILFLFWSYNNKANGVNAGGNYEMHKDTTNIWFIIVPCFIFAWIFAEDGSLKERLWTFSEYLEGFCMVPQYVFQYRQSKRENFKGHLSIFLWIICIGLYRVFYFFNWVYRVSHTQQGVQLASWFGGGLQIAFFVDFLIYFPTDFSFLKTLVLAVDDKVNDAGDSIELSVFPSRAEEVEQKKLRRRNLGDNNPYQQIKCVLDEPTMLGRPEFDDIL